MPELYPTLARGSTLPVRLHQIDAGAALDQFLLYLEAVNAGRYKAAAAPRRRLARLGLDIYLRPTSPKRGRGGAG